MVFPPTGMGQGEGWIKIHRILYLTNQEKYCLEQMLANPFQSSPIAHPTKSRKL